MFWSYSRQLLLNLRNLRFTVALEYNIKERIKYLQINKKFQFRRGDEENMVLNTHTDSGTQTVECTGKC